MHIFRVKSDIYDPLFKTYLRAGVWYLAETQNVVPDVPGRPSAIEARYPIAEIKPLRWEEHGYRTAPRYDDPDEKIWVIRAGGYGDLFYLLPVLKVIASKLKSPKENLVLQTAMESFPSKVPLRFEKFPSALDVIPREFAILNMEDIPSELENDFAGSTVARYARRAGLDASNLSFDDLFPDELNELGEKLWFSWYGSKRPRIFVALSASAATRAIPTALQIVSSIHAHAAIYFASPITMPLPFPAGQLSKPEEFIAAVMTADAVVGADTGPTHLGIILGKPVFAVFGAIPSWLRIPEQFKDSKRLKVIDIPQYESCPCRMNKAFCPVTMQPVCFSLAALTKRIIEELMDWIPSVI